MFRSSGVGQKKKANKAAGSSFATCNIFSQSSPQSPQASPSVQTKPCSGRGLQMCPQPSEVLRCPQRSPPSDVPRCPQRSPEVPTPQMSPALRFPQLCLCLCPALAPSLQAEPGEHHSPSQPSFIPRTLPRVWSSTPTGEGPQEPLSPLFFPVPAVLGLGSNCSITRDRARRGAMAIPSVSSPKKEFVGRMWRKGSSVPPCHRPCCSHTCLF